MITSYIITASVEDDYAPGATLGRVDQIDGLWVAARVDWDDTTTDAPALLVVGHYGDPADATARVAALYLAWKAKRA